MKTQHIKKLEYNLILNKCNGYGHASHKKNFFINNKPENKARRYTSLPMCILPIHSLQGTNKKIISIKKALTFSTSISTVLLRFIKVDSWE